MDAARGLMAVWMSVPAELEDELNRWYDEEHLRERMNVPGFLRARRYVSLHGEPKYIALYDLEDVAVLGGDAYRQVRSNPTPWTRRMQQLVTETIRNEYELLLELGTTPPEGAPYALLVCLETEPEHEAELNEWYNSEHLPALAGVPGVHAAKRYRAVSGSPKYLALYELASADVPQSEAWKAAADTPWTLKLRPLFKSARRNLAQRIAVLTKAPA